MKRLLNSRFVDRALRGAALVVTDRRWAAPLSAAALGFGIFAGVAIGPGTAGSLATGAQQIIELPSSGGEDGQGGGGGGPIVSAESPTPFKGGGAGGFEEAFPSVPLAPEPVEPLPVPASQPTAKPVPAAAGDEEEVEAEEPEGQAFEGTVVHANPAAGSYALAIEGGELVSIHAPALPEPGTVLSAPLRRLANGTFAEAGELEAEKKTVNEATFRGTVTFIDADPAAPVYTVSGRGSSLLVHVDPDPAGAAPELPPIGSYVTVTATLDSSLQKKVEVEPGPPSTYLDLAGVVREVLPDTNQLLFSADWAGESESNLTLTVPGELDAKQLKVGDSYLATAEMEPDGSLKLSGIASDEHTKGADDDTTAQGDLAR